MHSYLIVSVAICLLYIATDVSAAPSSTQNECELNLNGTESRGSIAFLASSSVTSDNALFCSCPNNTVDLILPDGSVAVDDSAIDVLSAPGSIRIFPKSGMLSQGVYVCRINGQDQLYAYVLDSINPSYSTECTQISSDSVELVLSSQLMDLAPENLCCFENDSPIGVDPVINITDRSQRPIATQLSIPFTPSLTEGSLMCNFSSGSWTVNLMCYYSISALTSLPPNLPLQVFSQVSVGSAASENPQIEVGSISQSMPLWCQGSNSGQSVSWVTPLGETISAGNNPSSLGVISSAGALGIYPGNDDFPEGIYMCLVAGQSLNVEVGSLSLFASPAIVADTHTCQIQADPSQLTISVRTTGGIIKELSCNPSANEISILPVMTVAPFTFTAMSSFSPITPGMSYNCTASNNVGSFVITCDVLDFPSNFAATRDTTDPSIVKFSWQSSSSSLSLVEGYTITIFSPDGNDILQTVPVSSSTTNSIEVIGLDPQQEISATISATSTAPTSAGLESDSIVIPVTTTRQCKPAIGHTFTLCLARLRRDGEDNSSCDCDTAGFHEAAIDQLLQSDCINSAECLSPMNSSDTSSCECKAPGKERSSKNRKPKKEMTNNKPEKTNGGKPAKINEPKNGRMEKPGHDKTPMIEVCIEGTLMCGSCEAADARRRRNIEKRLRFKRKPSRNEKTKSTEKTKSGTLPSLSSLKNACQSSGISVQGINFNIKKSNIKERNFYCGDELVTETDKCDCPQDCSN